MTHSGPLSILFFHLFSPKMLVLLDSISERRRHKATVYCGPFETYQKLEQDTIEQMLLPCIAKNDGLFHDHWQGYC